MPLLALRSRRSRLVVTAAVCVFAVSAIYAVADRPFDPGRAYPGPHAARALVRFADRERVSFGYAGYWEAASFTWQSKLKVNVYPVYECRRPAALTLCPFYFHRISTWYSPRPATRSFLIVDPAQPFVTGPADPAFGRPEKVYPAGPLKVYVYGYDIASRFAG